MAEQTLSDLVALARQNARAEAENPHAHGDRINIAADTAMRTLLIGLENALKPVDEVDSDGMPYRWRPSAVRVIDGLLSELQLLEHSDG